MRMLDLFSGSGSASRAAHVRGWEVLRIDNGEGTAADLKADLGTWQPPAGAAFDLVWASPPCTQLSTASAKRDVEAGMVLVRAALRIIREVRPRWWVLENVHGATRAIGSLIGPPVATYGSFYLWGVFPPFAAEVAREKSKLSGRRRAQRRAAIPWAISDGLVRACEALARELGGGREPGRGELGGSSGLEDVSPLEPGPGLDLAPSRPRPAPEP
jgi:C-5 cytosine-specific DNA methylase